MINRFCKVVSRLLKGLMNLIMKNQNEILKHKEESIAFLDEYMTSLAESAEDSDTGKCDKLAYWLKDWTNYLKFEGRFDPSRLRRYKRGEIVKVHLGFNVGSEEGGLHYGVVLDKNNSIRSSTITIVPLTSVKPSTKIDRLGAGRIYLGNELFTNLNAKTTGLLREVLKQEDAKASDINRLKRHLKEITKLKRGSIALINQIRTISKMRIYDPKTNYDVLSGIKLSNEKLDLIDNEIVKLFVRNHTI